MSVLIIVLSFDIIKIIVLVIQYILHIAYKCIAYLNVSIKLLLTSNCNK